MKTIITAIVIAAVISGSAGAASLLIDGKKLKNHSVPVTKLTASAVKSLRGQRGPQGIQGEQGEQGEQGDQGDQGDPGPPGLSGYVSVTSASVAVAAGEHGFAGAWCPAGTQPLGGGYFPLGATELRAVSATFGIQDVTNAPGFLVEMANEGVATASFKAAVRCAHVS